MKQNGLSFCYHAHGYEFQPFGEGTQNFQVMREWNRSEVYRKTLHYFAEQLRSRGD